MDIKELKKFENYLLEKHSVDVDDLIGIKFVEDENEYKIVGANWAVELEDACTELNVGWDAWQAAKASAVPDGFKIVSFKQISELVVAVNKVDLMTHTEQKTNEARLAWQDIASKLQTMIEALEPTND